MRRCPVSRTRAPGALVVIMLVLGSASGLFADPAGRALGASSPTSAVNPATSILLERTGGAGSPFQMTNITNKGNQPVSIATVGSLVEPPSIVPPNPNPAVTQEPPLTILAGSSGFTPDDLKVFLGEGSLDGKPAQGLVLDFGPKGLAPGGVINFSLTTSPTNADIRLVPEVVEALTATPPFEDPPTTPGPTNNVPEPMSVVLWSAAIALGLARARAHRRTRLAAV